MIDYILFGLIGVAFVVLAGPRLVAFVQSQTKKADEKNGIVVPETVGEMLRKPDRLEAIDRVEWLRIYYSKHEPNAKALEHVNQAAQAMFESKPEAESDAG